jgi:hypothetical protein
MITLATAPNFATKLHVDWRLGLRTSTAGRVSMQTLRLPTIRCGPTLKPSVVKNIRDCDGLATKDEALLLEVVSP